MYMASPPLLLLLLLSFERSRTLTHLPFLAASLLLFFSHLFSSVLSSCLSFTFFSASLLSLFSIRMHVHAPSSSSTTTPVRAAFASSRESIAGQGACQHHIYTCRYMYICYAVMLCIPLIKYGTNKYVAGSCYTWARVCHPLTYAIHIICWFIFRM